MFIGTPLKTQKHLGKQSVAYVIVSRSFLAGAASIAASALCLSVALLPAAQAGEGTDTKLSLSWNTFWGGKMTKGSGKVTTDKRTLSGYDALGLKGSLNVKLRQAAEEGVEVTGDDNIVPFVETRVEGNTLVVTTKKGVSFSTRNPITVLVKVKSLKAIAISGSGDLSAEPLKIGALATSISGSGNVHFDGLQADSFSLVIAGSGDFTANGKAAQQTISISGSGDVRADKLEGEDVTVTIAGSGDASVWAKGTLTASVAGSGDIRYVGDPKVTQRIAGSGSVARK